MKYNVKYVEYPHGITCEKVVTRETHYELQSLNHSLEGHGYGKNFATSHLRESGFFGFKHPKPSRYDSVEITLDPDWWE